jgi:hypothetical protein
MEHYIKQKHDFVNSTGFDNGFAQINFSTHGEENLRKLIDVSLGIEKEVDRAIQMTDETQGPSLTGKEIQDQVFKRLNKYENRNFFEQFATFMGVAQILEIGLKNLLTRKFGFDSEKTEKWTLGRTKEELKRCGLRADFIALLQSVVDYRNYIAHELLANQAIMEGLMSDYSGRFEFRELQKGIYELEQVVFLFDWCQEHDAWV